METPPVGSLQKMSLRGGSLRAGGRSWPRPEVRSTAESPDNGLPRREPGGEDSPVTRLGLGARAHFPNPAPRSNGSARYGSGISALASATAGTTEPEPCAPMLGRNLAYQDLAPATGDAKDRHPMESLLWHARAGLPVLPGFAWRWPGVRRIWPMLARVGRNWPGSAGAWAISAWPTMAQFEHCAEVGRTSAKLRRAQAM